MSIEICMPQISMTMIDGTVVKWHKQVGDTVTEGEPLVDIQTDKIVDIMTAANSGVILSLAAAEGDIIPVGDLLCVIGQEGEAAAPQSGAVQAQAAQPQTAQTAPAGQQAPAAVTTNAQGTPRATPLAKKIAAQRGLDLHGLKGTGPGGIIVKDDLPTTAAASSTKVAALPPLTAETEDTIMPLDGIRRTIADNLMLSKRSAADVTTVADANMGAIKEMRKVLPLSYTSFAIMASAKALLEYPIMNALVEEERIILKKRVNISVAVATKMGLLTPTIHDAGTKNLMTISDDLTDLSLRGRDGKLTARDFEGGTFTVTNSGVYGSIIFTPIINHPQSAVLGLGRITPTPVVINDEIVPALMMYMSLSYNHRSIDGETAVKFLQRVRYYLENPTEMMGLKKKS